MYNFLRNNNRKLLAIFTAFLMIVFILPSTMGQFGGVDPVVGKLKGRNVFASEVQDDGMVAHEIVRTLERPGAAPQPLQEGLAQIIQFPQLLFLLREHPEAMFLLEREADDMGIHVSQIELQQAVEQMQIGSLDRDSRPVMIRAIESLLKIRAAFDRVGSAVKVSTPMIAHARAEQFQRINLNLVEFKADDFAAGVPTPSEDQLQKQFDTYADTIAGGGDAAANPFGFGYKYPDRVKLQWVMVPQTELILAARKARSDYDWTVEAQKEYLQNPQRYPSTQPATAPAFTTGIELPTEKPAEPTTRPFTEVRDQIVDTLVVTQATALRGQVLNKINAVLNADWVAYQKDASKPSSLGAAYDTFTYLEQLRDAIQKEFGLSVTVESVGSLRSKDDIAGDGTLKIASATASGDQSFADYIFGSAEAFIPEAERQSRFGLKPYQPTSALIDSLSSDAFVARIVEASASHKPANLAEVREVVEKDLKHKLAYEQAELAAKTLLEKARNIDLPTAASAEARKIISTGYFDKGQQTPYGMMPPMIQGYNVPAEATDAFVEQAYALLRSASEAAPKSKGLIALPRAGVALAGELAGVQSILPPDRAFMVDLMLSRRLQYEGVAGVLSEWFNWENLIARTQWEPAEAREAAEEDAPSNRQQPIPLGR